MNDINFKLIDFSFTIMTQPSSTFYRKRQIDYKIIDKHGNTLIKDQDDGTPAEKFLWALYQMIRNGPIYSTGEVFTLSDRYHLRGVYESGVKLYTPCFDGTGQQIKPAGDQYVQVIVGSRNHGPLGSDNKKAALSEGY